MNYILYYSFENKTCHYSNKHVIFSLVEMISLLRNMSYSPSNMIIGQFVISNFEIILPFTICIHK